MVGAKNIHDVSATTRVQKHASVAALTSHHRTCLPRRHTDRQHRLDSCSKRHSRLRGHLARSSKDDASSSQHSSESTEQQGMGRKQFLQALSGKVISIILQPVLSHVYIGHALPKCTTPYMTSCPLLCRQPLGTLPELETARQGKCLSVQDSARAWAWPGERTSPLDQGAVRLLL